MNFNQANTKLTFNIRQQFFFIHRVLFNQDKPFNFRYDFIFNRCRAVRQEVVIQNFSCDQTLDILEPIAMFLSFSVYRLQGSPISIFDPTICTQHLQECVLKCLSCYDELNGSRSAVYSTERRAIIEGIHLMLNMDETSALQRAIRLNAKLKSSYIIKTAIEISINFHTRDFYKVIRDMQDLPHLVSAVASTKLPYIRKEILRMFSIAYNSRSLLVPIKFLKSLLVYDEKDVLLQDLKTLGIDSEDGKAVMFDRNKFDLKRPIVSFVLTLVLTII